MSERRRERALPQLPRATLPPALAPDGRGNVWERAAAGEQTRLAC